MKNPFFTCLPSILFRTKEYCIQVHKVFTSNVILIFSSSTQSPLLLHTFIKINHKFTEIHITSPPADANSKGKWCHAIECKLMKESEKQIYSKKRFCLLCLVYSMRNTYFWYVKFSCSCLKVNLCGVVKPVYVLKRY
jgi:hypothetical protein